MQRSTTTYLVVLAAVAMAALIAFQAKWLRHSQSLMEKQFEAQVSEALTLTVDQFATTSQCQKSFSNQCVAVTATNCGKILDTLIKTELFASTLSKCLSDQDIDLPYVAKVQAVPARYNSEDTGLPPYSCSLDPMSKTGSHFVNLEFAGARKHILQQMGTMTGASLGILTFICLLFFYASYLLLRQQRMSELNREFFNHMAHEFRTPLTNIKLASRLLERKAVTAGNSQRHLQIIQYEAGQLTQHVEQVLYLARLEKNDYLLRKESFELTQTIREVIASMQLQVAQHAAQISFTPSHVSTQFDGDELHLSNALRNLIDNALKYACDTPVVAITLRELPQQIELTVSDNGPGLTDAQKRGMFEPFRRFNQEQACASSKGFGLGLAYVKRIVDLHEGQIHVHSQPGQGTRIELILPKP
ncbi:MAG: HAMP domain-containing sensor histidine kinase [Bacteroidota bacterium]